MKKFLFPLAFIIVTLSSNAQKAPVKFGKVDIEDLEMKVYEPDTSASAVVLCDYGYFDSQNFQFIRLLRIKILKKEGLKWADYSFPSSENTNLRAKTFNLENGEVVDDKLKSESIYKERITDDYYRYKVALPNVKVGSVVDIEYTHPLIPDVWYFQWVIPVRMSELRLESSTYIGFRKNYFGYVTLDYSDNWRWIAKNVPAFKEEAYTNSIENYISKFEFDIMSINIPGYYKEYTTSWEAVCKMLSESDYFGGALRGNLFLNSVAKDIEEKASTDLEKIKLAHEEVKKMKWDETERLFSTYTTLVTSYNKLIGNSADINLTLIALLNKMNINAHPVIISTRPNGLLPFYPTLEKLNYVIGYAKIGDTEYLLDATEELLPMGLLPKRCLNGTCRVLNGELSMPLSIEPAGKDKENVMYFLTLDDNLSLKGKLSCMRYDYAAFDFRKDYRSYAGEDQYLEAMENNYEGLRVNSMEINNLDSIYQPVSDNYEIEIKNAVNAIGDMLYISPMLHHQMEENPFKIDNRQYPVDYAYPIEKTYVFNYTIPENFEVVELPEPVMLKLPKNTATALYNVSQIGNNITITYKFSVNKALFVPAEYAHLKELYNLIIKKHAEPIILKRI